MILKTPLLLLLFLLYIPLIGWYVWKYHNSNPSMGMSTTQAFSKLRQPFKVYLLHFCFALQLVALGCMIVALCRPQTYDRHSSSTKHGTDIVLALDISGSMGANDFRPNRFEAAKDVASKFISQREDDNMGLVVFSGESLSLMPLTNDRGALINALNNVKMGSLNDGTAIGEGLSSAINRILQGQAKSKNIILLTDGANNAGDVPPSTATQIAKQNGIRIYTIGVGTNGTIKISDPYGFNTTTIETKIDEDLLNQMANATGGKFFRAKNENMLSDVFKEIDKLEKSRIDVNRYTTTDDNFMPWMLGALIAYVLQLLLRYTVLRRIP